MIICLHGTENVCIVAVDSAGFSTNAQHVRNFTKKKHTSALYTIKTN
jgi:hypothetical protein